MAQAKPGGDLLFIKNKGQWHEDALYKADLQGGTVFITQQGFRYSFYDVARLNYLHLHDDEAEDKTIAAHAYGVRFINSRAGAIEGEEAAPFYHNYFLGNDTSHWATKVPVFAGVNYAGLYPGIGMDVYSKGTALKYDLVVASGADTRQVQMHFDGVDPYINDKGDIVIKTSVNEIRELAPYAYQRVNGAEVEVPCAYRLNDGVLSFVFPEGYDNTKELVIDPALAYATYTGSTGNLWGFGTAYDLSGNNYSVCQAWAPGFPASNGAFQYHYKDSVDIAINKYNSTGKALEYSTYCGGSKQELPTAMRVNGNNELVISGFTYSTNFPVSAKAFSKNYNGSSDLFVTVLNSSGTGIVGSTYLGGSGSEGEVYYAMNRRNRYKGGLDIDGQGNIYIATATKSNDFPVSANAYDTTHSAVFDGIITKLSPDCSNLVYSTYLGGLHQDCIFDCRVKPNGQLVVCGLTQSNDFPLSNNAYSKDGEAFVSILNASGSGVIASTLLGEYSLSGILLSVDDSSNVFVCGNNDSSFAVSQGVFHQSGGKVFIAKLTNGLDSMIRSTKIVDVTQPFITGMVNVCGDVVVSVYLQEESTSLPLSTAPYQSTPGTHYFFHMNAGMDSLVNATYFGINSSFCHAHGRGNMIDTSGVIWATICISDSVNKSKLPGTNGSFCTLSKNSDKSDFYSAKLDMQVLAAKPTAVIDAPDTSCTGSNVLFENYSVNAYNYIWDFGDGDTSHAKTPVHQFNSPGTFTVKLKAYNYYSCKTLDEAYVIIYIDSVKVKSVISATDTACQYKSIQFNSNSQNTITHFWDFGDGATETSANPTHAFGTPGNHTVMLVAGNTSMCNVFDTTYKTVYVDGTNPSASFTADRSAGCVGMPIQFQNNTQNSTGFEWNFDDGTTSTNNNPLHSFKSWGRKNVRLIATNPALCVSADTAYKPINILRPLEIELADTFVCGDDPVEWSINMVHANDFVTYNWEPADAISTATDQPKVKLDPKKSTKYIVTVTDSILNMCSHEVKDTGNIIIVDYPTGTFAESNGPVCEGDVLLLRAGTTTLSPRIVYSWYGPYGYSSNGPSVARTQMTQNHAGQYRVVIDNEGCEVQETVVVDVKPTPSVKANATSPVYVGKDIQFTAGADMEVDSFIWSGPGGFLSFEQNPVRYHVTKQAAGSYTVKAIYDGCAGSAITIVTVDEPDSQYVKLYPNPNTGHFDIIGKAYHEQEVKMRIINSVGQSIYNVNVLTEGKKLEHHVDLPTAAGGVYVLWLLMDAHYWSIPFTIARE